MNKTVHLYWLWDQGPITGNTVAGLLKETHMGFSVCGRKVPKEELTAFLDDTTCESCKSRARQAA